MPPNRRANRGGAFGGSLLAVPTPLPDDEPIPQAEESELDQPLDAAIGSAVADPPTSKAPEGLAVARSQPSPALAGEALREEDAQSAQTARGSVIGRRPPSTIRLDDKAGHPLFDAFVEAKRQDPFLSYRQFASSIVLDGLTLHDRRQKRA